MSNQVLDRDGHRCNITGMFNRKSVKDDPALEVIVQRDNAILVTIQICHILSGFTMRGLDRTGTSGVRRQNKV